jgi:copper homeostasis protein (lipoprotein)
MQDIAALFLTCLALAAPLASVSAQAASADIKGTVTYRERMLLPPQARVRVTLEDVSRADATATLLAAQEFVAEGAPPYPFRLGYDPARIDARGRYAVRAEIRVDGWLWFTTASQVDPFDARSGEPLDLLARRVGASARDEVIARDSLPASFVGILPCADCPGMRYTLNLWPDQVYALRMEYLEREGAYDDIGRWEAAPENKQLALHGGREAPLRFAVRDRDTLRKLDGEGREIDSKLNHDLTRVATLAAFEPRLPMRGMFQYLADAGLFRECLTGRRMPVAQEADNAALEHAYAGAAREPGAPLLVNLEGRIARRAPMEGKDTIDTLVVERFVKVWPGQDCKGALPAAPAPVPVPDIAPVAAVAPVAASAPVATIAPVAAASAEMAVVAVPLAEARAEASLENTYWKALRAGERDLVAAEGMREAHIVLAPTDGEQRLQGFGGCNRMMGSYTVDRERILFGPIASTMMACVAPAMENERALGAALAAVRAWRIEGETLELLDDQGALLARFESVYLR